MSVWLRNLRAKVSRAWRAYRDPLSVAVTVRTTAPQLVGSGASRFVVERTVDGRTFVLYDGASGSEARRWYEHVKQHRELGHMRFLQDGVCRGTYEGPAS